MHNIVVYVHEQKLKHEVDDSVAAKAINECYDLLLERCLDASTYVRTKVLNALSRLCDLRSTQYYKKILDITTMAVASLEDKAAGVRKNSISLLIKLLKTNQYMKYEGSLDLEVWEKRRETVIAELAAFGLTVQSREVVDEAYKKASVLHLSVFLALTSCHSRDEDMEVDGDITEPEEEDHSGEKDDGPADEHEDDEDEDSMDVDEDASPKPKKRSKKTKPSKKPKLGPRPSGIFTLEDIAKINPQVAVAQLDKKEVEMRLREKAYTREGLLFIHAIEGSADTMVKLLASVNKTEVLEAIEFFYVAWNYKLQLANVCPFQTMQGVNGCTHLPLMNRSVSNR